MNHPEMCSRKNLPGRAVECRALIDQDAIHAEGMLHSARTNMARNIAEIILKERDFWRTDYIDNNRVCEVTAHAIICTEDELFRFGLAQYQQGREAGMYYNKR